MTQGGTNLDTGTYESEGQEDYRMKTYIVATDLSARADRAFRRAFSLAREHGARLIAVSVVDDTLPDAIAARLSAEMVSELDRLCEADADSGKVDYETRVLLGVPSKTIAELAREEKADLLILGIHRPRPFADTVRDTTMQRIIRLANCPVLLVRDPATKPYQTVLATVDFSPACAAAMKAAHKVAPKAKLVGVHALHIPYDGFLPAGGDVQFRAEAEAALTEWREAQKIPESLGTFSIDTGVLNEVISAAIAEHRPDLIAAGAHARAGLVRYFLGSFTTRLLHDPPCDVLVAPPPPRVER